jgi:hypothetical protein
MSRKSKNLTSDNYPHTVDKTTDANSVPSQRRPEALSTLPWEFADGDIVLVEWDDPANLTRAPWEPWSAKEDQPKESGLSVGLIFNYPDDEEVEVAPHVANIAFSDGDHELGEVFIPYSSIRDIQVLKPKNTDRRFTRRDVAASAESKQQGPVVANTD